MAIWLDNFGGSLDNAKKLVESGEFGGKGSATHKATVVGRGVYLIRLCRLVILLVIPAKTPLARQCMYLLN